MIESALLSNKDLREMADIMSEAFIEHQNWSRMIGPKTRRKKALYRIFLMMYKVINQYGLIVTIREKELPIGYVTFMDGSDPKQISFYRVLKTGGLFRFMQFILGLKISEIRDILSYMKTYNRVRGEVVAQTMHLYMVGILKEYRGKGYVSYALKQIFSHLASKGYQYVILETSDESNIPVYKKMNFTLETFVTNKEKNQKIYFFQKEI